MYVYICMYVQYFCCTLYPLLTATDTLQSTIGVHTVAPATIHFATIHSALHFQSI